MILIFMEIAMQAEQAKVKKEILNGQIHQWENSFSQKPDMFGVEPSEPARKAAELFRKEDKTKILELGAGQGRDTVFFARSGFQVYALDYSQSGIDAITQKAQRLGLLSSIATLHHDIRQPFPFDDKSFDGCYSHMLFCMALSTPELEFLSQEVRRVLKPNGINIYTVRHTRDAHYGTGIHRGEDMYEVGGFIVHFFTKEKVEHLADGWEIMSIDEFDEGGLPRKLFRVTLKKRGE